MSEDQTLEKRAHRALRGEEPWEPIMDRIHAFARGDLDAEITRLTALLAEAREGLEMCERNDRSEPYGYAKKGAPEASYRRAGDGAIPEVGKRWNTPREIARAVLAKLGA